MQPVSWIAQELVVKDYQWKLQRGRHVWAVSLATLITIDKRLTTGHTRFARKHGSLCD